MGKAEDILGRLQSLKESHPSLKAAMVARKGLDGLVMFPPDFKAEVAELWGPLSDSVDNILGFVGRYSDVGISKAYVELLGYGMAFLPLPGSDTAVIVFIGGKGPLKTALDVMPEMESAREWILRTL